nr:anthrone oxygenase family protein [uncultured Sphingomonas sp.]
MTGTVVQALLWFSAIGCGLIAGLYFAFSTFIVQALDRLGAERGAQAMNAINVRILRSLFMPLFLGTTLTSLALVAIGLAGRVPGGPAMAAGGAIYVIGMFVVTLVLNVPLNNMLAAARDDGGAAWSLYLRRWMPWNHVRTLSSTLACILFVAAI